jgi:PAS domain S-box-containing protein
MLKWLRRHLPIVTLLCFGSLVSIVLFISIRSLEMEKAKAAFQRAAQERFDDLQSELDLTVGKVVALGAFCDSSYPITHSSFDSFVTPLLFGRDAGIKALEWVPRVFLSQRAAFEESARRSGLPGYEIHDRLPSGKMVRSGNRPYYFPVLYLQPHAGNEVVPGYDDLVNNSVRREFFLRAASTGELTASPRRTLIQENSDQYGILIVRPVYRHQGGVFGKAELLGFAVGALRIGDVVEKHGTSSGVDLTLTDLTSSPGQQLYPSSKQLPQPITAFTQYRTITVGGRTWQLAASPVPGAFPVSNTYSYVGGVLSILITLLISAYSADLLGRRRQVECLVEERTRALNTAITSLADAHRGLEESEAKYRRLVEDSPNAIVVEREGKIVLVNRAATQLFDFDPTGDIEDHSLVEFVAPEHEGLAQELIRELSAHESRIPPRETRLLRRDGSMVEVEIAASSFSYGKIPSIQFVLRDITQRKRDQAENARLILAIEQVEESIVVTDLEAKIVYVNPAFERVSGYSREEVLGKNPRVLKSGLQSSEFYATLWRSLAAGESWNGRFLNRAKDGRLFTEEATISPVASHNGEITNYVAVKRDVTIETELEEQLHQSQKMDAIGRLAGGVAHDFNNMLMVIVSYADLIESSLPVDDPLREYIRQILSAAQRSSALTHQLLAFSRKQVLAPQILDCNAILSETSSMIRRIISENIDLKCNLAPELWNVKADADQIAQVILNLCVNARDAMPNGGSLILATRNLAVDGGFVEISVCDTGVGIPTQIQKKLFEPFFTTKERGKGTGLGLATVYGIVQQSGGSIRVESLPGHGATFTVQLPRCREDAALPDSQNQKLSPAGRSLILVVEDENALREALATHLRDHGYRVLTASDGIVALDILAQNPDVSILISDLIMPRMGGRELVQLAAAQSPDLRVIFMSGYADHDLSENQIDGGPMVFLQKPFTMDVLLTCLADLDRPDVTTNKSLTRREGSA